DRYPARHLEPRNSISAMIGNARLFASDNFLYGGGRGQRTAAMHGKLALYHPQHGIIPIAVALLAIIWTTIFLTWIQTYLVADRGLRARREWPRSRRAAEQRDELAPF